VKEKLEQQRRAFDPVALLHRIWERQEALAALSSRENNKLGPGQESLEQFVKQLGELWRQGEVRATHRTSPKKAHWCRPDRHHRRGMKAVLGVLFRREGQIHYLRFSAALPSSGTRRRMITRSSSVS
jgi:hypothetical protein